MNFCQSNDIMRGMEIIPNQGKIPYETYAGETHTNDVIEIEGHELSVTSYIHKGIVRFSFRNVTDNADELMALNNLQKPFTTIREVIELVHSRWKHVDYKGFALMAADSGKGDAEEQKQKAITQRELLFRRGMDSVFGDEIVDLGHNLFLFKKFADK